MGKEEARDKDTLHTLISTVNTEVEGKQFNTLTYCRSLP